jgi:hypothetical protein
VDRVRPATNGAGSPNVAATPGGLDVRETLVVAAAAVPTTACLPIGSQPRT